MIFTNGVLSTAAVANLFAPPPSSFSNSNVTSTRLQPTLHVESPVIGIAPGFSVLQTGSWSWDGIKIHGTPFKTAAVSKNSSPSWFAGHFPDLRTIPDQFAYSSGFQLDPEQARDFFAQRLRLGSWQMPLPEATYILKDGQFESWWRLVIPTSGIYWMREQDENWGREQNQPLHASAKAFIYRENKVASASTGLEEFELTDLLDVSYLRSKLFRILNCNGVAQSFRKCGNFARSNSGVYRYGFNTAEHSEMVAYYSMNRAIKWHQGIQSAEQRNFFSEFGLKGPIDVFVRVADSQNAFYSDPPNSLNSPNPYIVIGAGVEDDNVNPEDSSLRFLSKDSDVYIHEFAHHVMFRSIKAKDPSKQGRAIQEGLADFFTYAITGNNLLGESVSDQGGSLRQGNKTTVLEESFFPAPDAVAMYELGSVLSSVMWSMREASPEWRDGYRRIDKVIWDAIDLLPANATFYQLACAMYITAGKFEEAEGLAAGSVRTAMTDVFVQRNFFASATPASGENCPPISAVLQKGDSSEGEPSNLPPLETPRTPVTFTSDTIPALPPIAGSVYSAVQPRKAFCGTLAAQGNSKKTAPIILLAPLLFIGSRLRRFRQWLNRSR
jgi:hypothetical protein